MTATEVGGVAVVSDEPTRAPFDAPGGKAVFWQQIRTLTLADGTTAFGCVHCDYTSANRNSIRPHLHRHNGKRRGAARTVKTAASSLSLADLIEKAEQIDALAADRDAWKARAREAEKKLRMLRNALGGAA
ncbi:C2H2-type zinc finger protein [Amycolatopsis rubida]|uniref:C2H2-type domain-containing protein n=1 Tax=Amycolatopsis rubida TaxID=112413 RepID=A0A1I5IJ49_9PSEU|nr:C2H2-type zinc finger protein [Amycolatopsis rubida]SFO60597.1 hypothetical protein SAMN05421854_102504 [Amycolatopsis rubida]